MRLIHLSALALVFAGGCLRFDYEAHRAPRERRDAGREDAGSDREGDAAVSDAGATSDARVEDAALPEASAPDVGTNPPSDAALDDTGAPSDATVDAGTDPLPPCGHAGAVFCEDFESSSTAKWSYMRFSNGTAARTSERARAGGHSLRANTGAATSTNNEARYGARVFDHVTSGDLWLRAFYYVPSSVVAEPGFSTVVIAEIEEPYFGFSLAVRASRVDVAVGDTMYQGTRALPRDVWTCVELHVKVDASAGVFEAFLDGQLAARSPATDTLPSMGYTSLDVGIHYTIPPQGPVEVYVDDVVAGTARIGCD